YVSARHRSDMPAGELGIEMNVGGRDSQRSASRHGVARIDRKIQDQLVDLTHVRLHPVEVRPGDNLEIDVFVDDPTQHLVNFSNHRVQVQYLRRGDLLSTERQQLPRQAAASFACLLDLFDVGKDARLDIGPSEEQLAVTENGGQQIVEVVRDSAGQLADRLHLLRLEELSFQPLLFGDVARDAHHRPRV